MISFSQVATHLGSSVGNYHISYLFIFKMLICTFIWNTFQHIMFEKNTENLVAKKSYQCWCLMRLVIKKKYRYNFLHKESTPYQCVSARKMLTMELRLSCINSPIYCLSGWAMMRLWILWKKWTVLTHWSYQCLTLSHQHAVKCRYNAIQFYHTITYGTAITVAEYEWDFRITTDNPDLALTGEPWSVYFGEIDCIKMATHCLL